LIARYGVSRAVFREAVRMLEFFGVVEVRRGKEGGLVVAQRDPSGTVGSALLYLSFAGIDPAETRALLAQIRTSSEYRGGNPALELFERVLEAYSAGSARPATA
jgi:DNA-binding FadR family transcriptional regulator